MRIIGCLCGARGWGYLWHGVTEMGFVVVVHETW